MDSWQSVAEALKRAGIERPTAFTHEVEFRHCPDCQELSIVRENYFVCVFCGSELPLGWNVDLAGEPCEEKGRG
jgi:hypothetical protein